VRGILGLEVADLVLLSGWEARETHGQGVALALELEDALREAQLVCRRRLVDVRLGLVFGLSRHALLRRQGCRGATHHLVIWDFVLSSVSVRHGVGVPRE
jgi:hypothetical protein